MTAIALYDYQAAADDEISFDPNDIITNIEMVRKHSCFCASSWDMLIRILGEMSAYVSLRTIVSPFQVDDGWWLGECHGKFGLFPANYVEIKQ